MDIKLAEALVSKALLPVGTEVKAKYLAVGLGGIGTVLVDDIFTIKQIFRNPEGELRFQLESTRDGVVRRLPAVAIFELDGMDPERFAAVWDIKADGGAAKVGKRRGRKPKDRSIKVEG
jgi:hypothetical protein